MCKGERERDVCGTKNGPAATERESERKETYSPVLLFIVLDLLIGGVLFIVPRSVISTELLGPTLLRLGIFHLLSGEMEMC